MTSPILPMSVANRLNASLAQQNAMSPKSKKDKKRKRASGGGEVIASAMEIDTQSTKSQDNGADIKPTVFSSKKVVSESKKALSESFSDVERLSVADAEIERSEFEEDKAARKKRKREEKSARKAFQKANMHKSSSQGSRARLSALTDYEGSDIVETGGEVQGSPAPTTLKSNKTVALVKTPDAKIKSDALMQTILKGRKREATSPPNSLANAENPETANHTELVATKEPKAKERRKSRAKNKNVNATGTNDAVRTHDESLSQTIESIKKTSTAKLENLFPHLSSPSPENNFFDDEPLIFKRDRTCISAATSSRANLYAASDATFMAEMAERRAKKKALEEWEKSPGKVRGVVAGANADEEPEENIAFSASYIDARDKGISIRGTNFNVITIATGVQYSFKMDEGWGLRVCSVAAGRVEVGLGKMKFDIGESGMWRVIGGESCKVRNVGNEIAEVHVTSMQ